MAFNMAMGSLEFLAIHKGRKNSELTHLGSGLSPSFMCWELGPQFSRLSSMEPLRSKLNGQSVSLP